jgi:hypothetical protein
MPGARTATCRGTWKCIGDRSWANTPVPELPFSST